MKKKIQVNDIENDTSKTEYSVQLSGKPQEKMLAVITAKPSGDDLKMPVNK